MLPSQSRTEKPDFNVLMEEQGGFGPFQTLAYLLVLSGMNSFGWLMYNMAYFSLYPEYAC